MEKNRISYLSADETKIIIFQDEEIKLFDMKKEITQEKKIIKKPCYITARSRAFNEPIECDDYEDTFRDIGLKCPFNHDYQNCPVGGKYNA